jgi:hypothetical protein
VMNALVTNGFSTMAGINDRALRMQLITAQLLGLAYTRYVVKIEPFASLPVEEIIALSVPVVRHYMADCPPVDRYGAHPCVFVADDQHARRCELCSPRTADKQLARSGSSTAARRCDHGTAARRDGCWEARPVPAGRVISVRRRISHPPRMTHSASAQSAADQRGPRTSCTVIRGMPT